MSLKMRHIPLAEVAAGSCEREAAAAAAWSAISAATLTAALDALERDSLLVIVSAI